MMDRNIKRLIIGSWLFFVFLSLGTNVYQDLFAILKRPPEQIDGAVIGQLFLLFLPLFVGCGGIILFWQDWRHHFQWGSRFIVRPIGIMTGLIGISLLQVQSIFWPQTILMVVVFWLVYLFIVNEPLPLRKLFLTILLLQVTIGILQFVLKHDLGLQWLGEPQLGQDVLHVGDIPYGTEYWLRSTGLSHNANRYAMMIILLFGALLSLPMKKEERLLNSIVGLAGLAAVLASVSRSGLLSIVVAVFIFGITSWYRQEVVKYWPWKVVLIGLFLATGIVYLFREVLLLRFIYYSAGYWEIMTLSFRHQANLTALGLMIHFPWLGVGVGRYGWFSYRINSTGILVHNVPLWVGAELGWPGFIVWNWLLWIPMISKEFRPIEKGMWGAMIFFSLFNPGPGILTGLHGTILFAVICGIMGRYQLTRNFA